MPDGADDQENRHAAEQIRTALIIFFLGIEKFIADNRRDEQKPHKIRNNKGLLRIIKNADQYDSICFLNRYGMIDYNEKLEDVIAQITAYEELVSEDIAKILLKEQILHKILINKIFTERNLVVVWHRYKMKIRSYCLFQPH